jgi:hypothetical protein
LTTNNGLTHAGSIDQNNLAERGFQVKHMKKIYKNAHKVQVWLGSDNEEAQAETAVSAIEAISGALYAKLDLAQIDARGRNMTYQELLLKHKESLPSPREIGVDSEKFYHALAWLYSHRYFTRIWVIQEISANEQREINIGAFKTTWDHLDLVASYVDIEPSLATTSYFSKAYCWWVSTIAEMVSLPDKWLSILYLASNFECLDARDVIYGLRGLMNLGDGEELLNPDYGKSLTSVYRDTVKAALTQSKTTDVLLYAVGKEHPSWIPRWDIPMLFRNPFRFGDDVPFKPAGGSTASWSIDDDRNELTLQGFIAGRVKFAATYNQRWFADSVIDDVDERTGLKESWRMILQDIGASLGTLPLAQDSLTALAVSLSFGFGRRLNADERLETVRAFVAYLLLIWNDDQEALGQHIPSVLLQQSTSVEGHIFGKPVWDFKYPDASIFVTEEHMIGCVVSASNTGDEVFVPYGSTYPVVLRPNAQSERKTHVNLGYAYVEGAMFGEMAEAAMSTVTIS